MHALSHRYSRLVGLMLIAAVIVGTPRLSVVAQDTDDAAVGAAAGAAAGVAAEAAAGPTATAAYNRAMRLFHNGRYEEALPYFVTAEEEAAAQHGQGSSEHATALNNLAELYRLMERYDEAEPLFRQALTIEEARLGADDPGLASPLNNLALLLRAQGRYEEAERDHKRSLAILEDTLGRRHPDVAGSLNNLARLYETMGLNERAQPLLERALMIAEDTLGPAHPSTQQISSNLARVSADLAAAPADRAVAGERQTEQAMLEVEAAEAAAPPTPGAPAELVLPPAARPASPIVTPLAAPAPDAAPMPAFEALPEPAAGLATVTTSEPTVWPLIEGPATAAPDDEVAQPEAGPEPAAVATAAPVETDVAPAAGAGAAETSVEDAVAMVLPLPEARPSGQRWAKLSTGRFAIHLASVRSPVSATEEWIRLRDQLDLPSDIGQLEPMRIEVVGQGVFYRVLGGPFESRSAAVAACQPIRDQGDFCAVLGHED